MKHLNLSSFLIIMLFICTICTGLKAQAETYNDEIALADEAIAAPTMNLEGKYQIKTPTVSEPKVVTKKVSASDRLKIYRERLEERNRVMIEKRIEQIRVKQEIALAKKLEESMNQTFKAINAIK